MPEVPPLQRKWLRGKLQLIARQYGLDSEDVAHVRAGGVWSGDVSDHKKQGLGDPTIRSRSGSLRNDLGE